MKRSEPNRSGPSSAVSTSSQSSDSEPIASNAQSSSSLPDLKGIHEQRRIRHIVSILVRNLESADVKESGQRQTPLRPRPHRSISIASNHSAHTLKRTSSNRTLKSSMRRRASSIASIHHSEEEEDRGTGDENGEQGSKKPSRTYQPPSLFLPWDANSLRKAIYSRFTYAFVSFADSNTSRVIYRTPITKKPGLHHAWGNTAGSDIESADVDLSYLNGEDGSMDEMHVSLWVASQLALESFTLDPASSHVVQPGAEERHGFQLVWERDVNLQSLIKVEKELSNVSLMLPPNAVILGMRLPLAEVHIMESNSDEQPKDAKHRDEQAKAGISKSGNVTQYYILPPEPQPHEEKASPEVEEETTMERGIIRRLLKEGILKRGYDIADILQILQLQRQMLEEQQKIEQVGQNCDPILSKEDSDFNRSVKLGEDRESLRVLIAKRDATRENVKLKQRQMHDRNEALHRRRARLEIARRLMINRRKGYEELRRKMEQLSKVRLSIEAKIYGRRVVMLRQVEYIYPIDLIDGAQLLFGIVDIPLMNRDGNENMHSNEKRSGAKVDQSDDIVSSALGMVGQMVALISAYTDAPLHYPIATAGSRSVIQDGISVMSGPRAFPLYSKGVERYRYEYGHFLLNKDIEQLMNHAGITILDIRNTLPNLKNLIVTLTASNQANSKLSRRNHIGSEMISLPNSKVESLGKGRPGNPTNDKHQQGDQIGYGAVVDNQSILRHTKTATAGSRWGMSLLGWGTSTNGTASQSNSSSQISSEAESAMQATLPTSRTLGRSK